MKRTMSRRRAARGMSLIEMMVALVIGLVMTLAVFLVMANFEGRRRTLTSTTDLDQAASVAMFQIDRWVRSAGGGFVQSAEYAYGCALNASKSGTQILPNSSLSAPFDSVNPGASGVFRLAPAMILPGQTAPGASVAGTAGSTSDVLVLMSAASASGEVSTLFSGFPADDMLSLSLTTNAAFTANDLLLLADQQPAAGGGINSCLLTQASSTAVTASASTMSLGGTWYAGTVNSKSVTSFSDTGTAIALGNPGLKRLPSFQLVGVGDQNTLYTYDLLQTESSPLQARAQGVFELHALYGVDATGSGTITWVKPTTSPYTYTELGDGSAAAAGRLKSIKALRVGLLLRTALPERDDVQQAASLKLFSDLTDSAGTSLEFSRSLSSAEKKYRYRTMEATIPVRNNLLL